MSDKGRKPGLQGADRRSSLAEQRGQNIIHHDAFNRGPDKAGRVNGAKRGRGLPKFVSRFFPSFRIDIGGEPTGALGDLMRGQAGKRGPSVPGLSKGDPGVVLAAADQPDQKTLPESITGFGLHDVADPDDVGSAFKRLDRDH